MRISFRVYGENHELVAQELRDQLKIRFKAESTFRKISSSGNQPNGSTEKIDPVNAAVLLVEASVISFEVYRVLILEPADRKARKRQESITHWRELVLWAKSKLPTTIQMIIGDAEPFRLDEAEPERLHMLTEKAIEKVSQK